MEGPLTDIGASLAALCVALDERDVATRKHCDRVLELSEEIGRACALSERELRTLRLAAGLHDAGKIGIPDAVLHKPSELSDVDWAIMKTHPVRGERIVLAARLDDSAAVALAVRHHHERFDGEGYPDRLSGEAIPFLARIIAVADAYDAMSRVRHYYAPARLQSGILDELALHSGRQHDPYVLAKLERIVRSAGRHRSER